MNRRSFLQDMLKMGVACAFLPGAGRIWKPVYQPVEELPWYENEALLEGCYYSPAICDDDFRDEILGGYGGIGWKRVF